MFESSRSARAHQILSDTDRIVAQSRKLTLELLKNLHEIELNKFYLELGYSSMFDYCTQHLKYSEPAAQRRIRTARCLAAYPQLHPLLEAGDASLTTVAMISYHVKPANAAMLIDAIKGRSKREVEQLIAALEPLSTIPPDRIRPIVVPVAACAKSTFSGGGKKLSGVEESTSPGDSIPAVAAEALQFQRMRRVDFTMREEVMARLERVRSLASHRLPMNASFEELIDFMAGYFLHREDPAEREQRREARAAKPTQTKPFPAPSNPRHVPTAVKDKILVRDNQQCTYVGPDGKRCGATHVLQVDHIKPVARRGAATIDNLRVLCAQHNRLEAEKLMGVRRRA